MQKQKSGHSSQISRRDFLGKAAVASAAFTIIPRFVLGRGYRAPSDMVNLGMIGTGRQGGYLARAFLDTGEAQWLAFCDVYKTKLDAVTQRAAAYIGEKGLNAARDARTYQDFREVLARPDIDAVVVVMPDHWHAAAVVRAAEAGKDIYCEKPLSLTIREGRAMVNAVRAHDRVFQTGSMQRSWHEFRQAAELVRNGYIGDIRTVKVSVGGPPIPFNLAAEPLPDGLNWDWWLGPNTQDIPYNSQLAPHLDEDIWAQWRAFREFGGGGMTDWGAHMFDIAQWGLDMDESGPLDIIPPDDKDYPNLTYRYANGITMTHEHFAEYNGVRFMGTKGVIDVRRGTLITEPEGLATREIGKDEKRVYFSDNHYKDFLKAMRDRSRPICDVETGHRTCTVCTLGNMAYELKRPLHWDPAKEVVKDDAQANEMMGRKMREAWGIKI